MPILRRLKFYLIKLPLMIVLMISGFMFEFILNLPFIVMIEMENRFNRFSGKTKYPRFKAGI
ncbi:MAG: hypothetical protein HQK79_02520 [Desulfobacterales bacterium]|nr:hypothetical protein [Desulfobacterales bacterium]MBF0396506.1 hypothetical protein [Desulfobacterales bacterium]